MNCKRAQLYIALRVGDDLDDAALSELRGHLKQCPPCGVYAQRMITPLQDCELRSAEPLQDSLWPDLFEKLPPRPGRRTPDFHGWWAASAVVVACFAIGLFWHDEARSGHGNRPVVVVELASIPDTYAYPGLPPEIEHDRRDQPWVSDVKPVDFSIPDGSDVGRDFPLLRLAVGSNHDDAKQRNNP